MFYSSFWTAVSETIEQRSAHSKEQCRAGFFWKPIADTILFQLFTSVQLIDPSCSAMARWVVR